MRIGQNPKYGSSTTLPGKTINKLTERPTLKLGTWNVRSMMGGYSENLQEIDDSRDSLISLLSSSLYMALL